MNYDWRSYADRGLLDRYPEGVRGRDVWREEVFYPRPRGRFPSPLMEERTRVTAPLKRPCVFISHRRTDEVLARHIAEVVTLGGCDYWLDVLDPNLASLPKDSQARTVAGIIEIALLNSTHVIAVITENTKGSMWVPYEYGRVKDPVPYSPQAACHVPEALQVSDLPEYLLLGEILRDDSDVLIWLAGTKIRSFSVAGSGI